MAGNAEIREEYASSLADLTFNSKPLINVLTILADEYSAHAKDIVEAIETHLSRVRTEVKLPVLYLIDCIMKNVGEIYMPLFCQNIVSIFCNVFEQVDERTRSEMFRLRQTWNEVLPAKKLYALDVQIHQLDPAWPVTAQPPSSIHLNPKFLKNNTSKDGGGAVTKNASSAMLLSTSNANTAAITMQKKLIDKQKELLELQRRKLELELLQTQVKIQEQQLKTVPPKVATTTTTASSLPHGPKVLLKPEVAKQLLSSMSSTKVTNTITASKSKMSLSSDYRPRGPPEKIPRLHDPSNDKSKSTISPTNKDVDLRHSSSSKKRSNKSTSSPSSKKKKKEKEKDKDKEKEKTKAQMIDILFGSEDTDLRKLAPPPPKPVMQDRLATPPPPPIISEALKKLEGRKDNNNKEKPVNPSLQAVRAKMYKEKNKLKDSGPANISESMKNQIIISPADEECIKAGNMTKAQETALMNKIIAQIETQKLKEAQRKESESSRDALQPISDEEVDAEFSASDTEENNMTTTTTSRKPIDKDDRIPLRSNQAPTTTTTAAANTNSSSCDSYGFQRKAGEDPRRGGGGANNNNNNNWRDRRRPPAKPFDNFGGARPNFRPDPWIRTNAGAGALPPPPPPTWRPLAPNMVRPPLMAPLPFPAERTNAGALAAAAASSQQQQQQQHNLAFGENLSPNAYGNTNAIEPQTLHFSHPDSIKSIVIDSQPRQIRYYDETAIVFMNWNDPREITFQNGSRVIFFDDDPHLLAFNEPYKEIVIRDRTHRVRLGAPSREIFIDANGYECYFDGIGKRIALDGRDVIIKLEPPPPQVKIGAQKRTDLVAGMINMVIDAKVMIPLFLDPKMQTFHLEGNTHTLQFTNALRSVYIDEIIYHVEFGGLPKPIFLAEKKHFIRFSVLPNGVRPGHVRIKDMDGCGPDAATDNNENSLDGFPAATCNEPTTALPMLVPRTKTTDGRYSPDRNSNSPHTLQNILQQQNFNNLDMLSSVMGSTMSSATCSTGEYKLENIINNVDENKVVPAISSSAPTTSVPILPPTLNVNELFQRLVATGIVTTAASRTSPPPPPAAPSVTATILPTPVTSYLDPPKYKNSSGQFKQMKPITFDSLDNLKKKRPQAIAIIYTGMQCSTCGMRFPPDQTVYYSQHLDWHFRQNRKSKKSVRKAASRRWYYSLDDWKNYEELEDLEEREKSYFENQAQNEGANEESEEEPEIPCVPADASVQDAMCEVCRDRFEQFYSEEKEEWQLRMAVRVDGKNYHPLCYEDHLASLNDEGKADVAKEEMLENQNGTEASESTAMSDKEEPEGAEDDVMEVIECKLDDDDDDEEQVAAVEGKEEEEDDDDDVILNEVQPERIVIDDDGIDNDNGTENGSAANDCSSLPSLIVKEEPMDDGFIDVDNILVKRGDIKIKTEPIDEDEQVRMDNQVQEQQVDVDVNSGLHAEHQSSIDGNMLFDTGVSLTTTTSTSMSVGGVGGKIKINISKPIASVAPPKEVVREHVSEQEAIDPSQPLPPGEEPVQLNVKPALKEVALKKVPVVKKGSELTGLCSIM